MFEIFFLTWKIYNSFSDKLKSVSVHCLQSATGHLQWNGLSTAVEQTGWETWGLCSPAVSASWVLYSPREPLESGPEQRFIIWTWQYWPRPEHRRSLGKRGGWRLHFVHPLLLYRFAFVVLGLSFSLLAPPLLSSPFFSFLLTQCLRM